MYKKESETSADQARIKRGSSARRHGTRALESACRVSANEFVRRDAEEQNAANDGEFDLRRVARKCDRVL